MEASKEKGSISEEDVSLLLRRYNFSSILALLQEVAQFPGVQIDWNALVKKTSTGITNAREYQMLWRHLAYRHSLKEKFEEGSEPLDDDSDLEFEVEAFPAVSSEASAEAAACVKVLIASGTHGSSVVSNSMVEAPLTINIPKDNEAQSRQAEGQNHAGSVQGMNVTIPVFVRKQPLPGVSSGEGLDCNGSGAACYPAKKKRKLWTHEEDEELIAAVQKCGEGNWANILKTDFKRDRTASQLSQRWAILRKRQATTNWTPPVHISTSSALSDAQLATRQAVSMALNMPMASKLSSMPSFGMPSNPAASPSTLIAAPTSTQQPEPAPKLEATQQAMQPPQPTTAGNSQRSAAPQCANVRPTPKKSPTQLKTAGGQTPNPLVQAAAVAAGARIAPPSTAVSLLKAAQSRNAVHIRPGGVPLANSMLPIPKPSCLNPIPPRPSNVHYIRTGLSSSPPVFSGTAPTVRRSAASAKVIPINQASMHVAPSSSMLLDQAVQETIKPTTVSNMTSENASHIVGDEHTTKAENLFEGQRSLSPKQACPLNSEAHEDHAEVEDSNVGDALEEAKMRINNISHEVENVENLADDAST